MQQPDSVVAVAFCYHHSKKSAMISVYTRLHLDFNLCRTGFSRNKSNCQNKSLQEWVMCSFSRATVVLLSCFYSKRKLLCPFTTSATFIWAQPSCTSPSTPTSTIFPLQAAVFHKISKGALQFKLSFHRASLNFWSKYSIFYNFQKQILLVILLLGIYLLCA